MPNGTLRVVLAIVVACHSIGHMFFLIPYLGLADWGQSGRSWLLTNLVGDTSTRVLGSLLWLAAIVAFMVVGYGLFAQQAWWRTLFVGSAALSLATVTLFADRLAGPAFNAAAFDVIVLVALLLVRWPSVSVIGS